MEFFRIWHLELAYLRPTLAAPRFRGSPPDPYEAQTRLEFIPWGFWFVWWVSGATGQQRPCCRGSRQLQRKAMSQNLDLKCKILKQP